MFCLIEHLDVWILSPLLVGGLCFVLLFVLARCARVEPQRSFHSTDSAGMQMWRRAAKLSSCDVFTPEICYTHTLSQTHTDTHTLCWHAARLCRGRSGGRTGHPARLAAQLRPWLGSPPPSACTHGVGRSHSPPNLHTHTEWCTAAVFNPPPGCRLHTYMLDGRWGVEDVGGGEGGGCWGNPCKHTYRHTQAWCQLAVKSGGWPLAVIKHQLGSGQPTGAPPCCPVHSSTSQLASSSTPPSSPPPPLCTLAESEIFSSHICGNKCSSHRKLWSFSSSIISIFSHVNTEIYFHNDHMFALRRAHLCCLIMHKMETWTWGETQFQSDFLRFYSTQSFR